MGTLFSGIRPDTIGILMLVSRHIAMSVASCVLDFQLYATLATQSRKGPEVHAAITAW